MAVDAAQVREVVHHALIFVNKLDKFLPDFLESPEQPVPQISQKMRQKLSRPTIFAALQILMRIQQFADETETAYDEERDPGLPYPKGHLDYSVRKLWQSWKNTVQTLQDQKMDWKPVDWNPYTNVSVGIGRLVSRIWSKHFNVEGL